MVLAGKRRPAEGRRHAPGHSAEGFQRQDLSRCRSRAPGCLVHTVCAPAVCQQSLLPLPSSRTKSQSWCLVLGGPVDFRLAKKRHSKRVAFGLSPAG